MIQLGKENVSAGFNPQSQPLGVVVTQENPLEMEFDLIGVHAAIANAFRRVLIAQVPTMAIETCYVMQNTGVMYDEVLCHRLGLLPVLCDARLFEFREDDPPTDRNTIVFKLKHSAREQGGVYSSSLEWVPQGEQEDLFKDSPIKVQDDILLTKVRPGDELEMELHCRKGTGAEHAKWSPVATASYRLLPHIEITQPITGKDALKFQKCFPPGVVKITMKDGVEHAEIDNPRKDTASRECLRHKEFQDKVKLGRVPDHFIFSIESTGAFTPRDLVKQSADILIDKCRKLREALKELGL